MIPQTTDLTPSLKTTLLDSNQKVKRSVRAAWLLWLLVPVLFWWALKDISFAEVWGSIRLLTAWEVVALLVLNIAILVLFSLRWWIIIRGMGSKVGFVEVFRYRLASFGVSYFTPGPQIGGEIVQVHLLHKMHGISTANAISSVFLDKMIEILANFTFLVFGLLAIFMTGFASDWLMNGLWIPLAVVMLLPGLHLAALWKGIYPVSNLLGWITRNKILNNKMKRLVEVVHEAEQQIAMLCQQRPMTLLLVSVVSGVSLGLMLLEYGLLLTFIHLDVSIQQVLIGLTATRIAFLAPLPGGLGVLEASQVLLMSALGLPPAAGITVSLIMRGRDILVGGLGLWLGGWKRIAARQLGEGEQP
jgi:uncharacterized protein (TIRG00374 family)